MRFWLLAVVLTVAPCFADVDTSADSPKELAMALARKAKRAAKSGESAQAYIYYSEAAALQPGNRKYKANMVLLQTRAAMQSKPVLRASASPSQVDLSPEDVFDSLTAQELSQARELKELPSLRAKVGEQNFDLNGDSRSLFDNVAQAFGLEPVYDGDYPKGGPTIRFQITGADYREALHDLEAATGSFVIPLSNRVFMVAQDTPAKRNDLEQTMAIAVPASGLTTQQLTEMGQVIRQTTNVEKIAWDSTQSRLVLRDRASRVLPAVALVQQLATYHPEVMIDLEFIQVAASDMINYGFTVTNSVSGIMLGNIFHNIVSTPSGITNLLTFGGGKTLIGITAAQAQAMFNETYATSNSLYEAQIRSVVGQPATFHVGEKYPVITGGYFGAVAPSQQGQIYAPPPSFTFEDLGIEMKVTPFVQSMDECMLTVETKFEVLTGQSINSIPVIGQRSLKSQVGVRNEQWTVIGTLLNTTNAKAVSGFWGLSQIPLLGELFRQTSTDKEDSNVLIGIRTHLLSLPPSQMVTKALRMGSEMRPFNPL